MVKKVSLNEAIKTPGSLEKGRVAKPKAAKPIEKKKWVNLTQAECLKSIKTAAHLSSKSVNSNASPVGVRLDPANRLPLHFVAVSTLDATKIPVDYVNGTAGARPLSQITSVLNGNDGDLYTEISVEQVSMIEGLREQLLSPSSTGTGFIDPRLRQVIWPTINDASQWVALTPLHSNGLSEVIRVRLKVESEKYTNPLMGKTSFRRNNAVFGVGGASIMNAANVGRFVGAMRRPLVFNGPKEVKSIRTAYALHFNGHLRGLAFAPPKKQTLAFAHWRHRLREANGQRMPSNAAIRKEEIDHIQGIASASLNEAAAARHNLELHQDYLSSLTAPTLNAFLRALIDPDLRDKTFKTDFARMLIRSVERFRYKIGNNEHVVCGDGELVALISAAEEVCP